MTRPPVDTKAKPRHGEIVSARHAFVIQQREPWKPPEDEIELPSPPPALSAPATINPLTTFLPPLFMLGAMFAYARFVPGMNPAFLYIMPLVGLGFPLANLIGYWMQKRSYKRDLLRREQKYRDDLEQTRQQLGMLVGQQRSKMNREYGLLPRLVEIALNPEKRKRLWWRRPDDQDFLWLRMGTGSAATTFKVNPPRMGDLHEPLVKLATELRGQYQQAPDLPIMLELPRVGSLAIAGKGSGELYGAARKLVLDIIVHHSPQDVQLVVMADSDEAQQRWEWLKWAPHTRALPQTESVRYLAFNTATVDACLTWLEEQYNARKNPDASVRKKEGGNQAIVAILDDDGGIRQSREARHLAAYGHDQGIYLLFVGGRNWPRECRARIDVADGDMRYVETWAGEDSGGRLRGAVETASLLDCERVSRALAALELPVARGSSNLPERVRLTEVLDSRDLDGRSLVERWNRRFEDEDLLQFVFGLRSGRKQLEPVALNLLPDDRGGISAYHTIMVATTGSGKSQFLTTVAISAAFRYPPKCLNFFFMDFKGGAAFAPLKDLPHVVGIVTNLGPELVERGLTAIESEMKRRQQLFKDAGSLESIWAYNALHPARPLPHLLLLLDEFSMGMKDFPRLPGILSDLVRLGRSLGMYMLLANQDVNSAVDQLLNNVGWHIVLRLAKQEDMHIIDRSRPKPERIGQGYLHSVKDDVFEFQAAYGGFPVALSNDDQQTGFKLYQVGADGRWQVLHTHAQRPEADVQATRLSEQDLILKVMKEAGELVERAQPIYLEPLPPVIPLDEVLEESPIQLAFASGQWPGEGYEGNRLVAPVGRIDFPQRCAQDLLELHFDDGDGHLWVIGAAGGGKDAALSTVLLSLALTHTPEEAQFYILEFGGGALNAFEHLPHTGAVIRPDEDERVQRLIKFLAAEMGRRASSGTGALHIGKRPEIFVVINNYSGFYKDYEDAAPELQSIIRDGRSVGMHVIMGTNRAMDLPPSMKSNIQRRIALGMTREEYFDLFSSAVPALSNKAEGRGYYASPELGMAECQVASPTVAQPGAAPGSMKQFIREMNDCWHGPRPAPIEILEPCIPLEQMTSQMPAHAGRGMLVPVGRTYETLELVTPDLLKEMRQWLILGPHRSGRSNFLDCVASAVLERDPLGWDVHYFTLRPRTLEWAEGKAGLRVISGTEQTLEACKAIGSAELPTRHTLLLIDDLGAAFDPGKDQLAQALNDLYTRLSNQGNVIVMATAAPSEVKMKPGSLIGALRAANTGVCFSRDQMDLELLGVQMSASLNQYRRMDLPVGRGFWVSTGKARLVQTPILEPCPDE